MLTCNMRNEFVAVRVYHAVKKPAITDEFAADFSLMPDLVGWLYCWFTSTVNISGQVGPVS